MQKVHEKAANFREHSLHARGAGLKMVGKPSVALSRSCVGSQATNRVSHYALRLRRFAWPVDNLH